MVAESESLLPRGGGSKPALSNPLPGADTLEMAGINGMLAYEPAEFTFTALAGSPLAEVQSELGANGQYLPFDPPLARQGGTLGGAVASGLSGSGAYRYGGMRDFILAVCFANSRGQLVRGGAKVVKNAAGFDLPKLMVGSLGTLGVLVELTFKVFPQPPALATVRRKFVGLEEALECVFRFSACQLDVYALDLQVEPGSYTLEARIGGSPVTLPARLALLNEFMGGGQVLQGEAEDALWQSVSEFDWAQPDGWLVKVPLTPGQIPTLEAMLAAQQWGEACTRRYLSGGQQVWIAAPENPVMLDGWLRQHDLSGLVIRGNTDVNRLGVNRGAAFAQRVKAALDPAGRFVEARHAA
jgi:glycolate oxidase FAD binding subunit